MAIAHKIGRSAAAFAVSLFVAAAPASAEPVRAPLQPAPHVVCRDVLPTGTMLRKSMICMNADAWNKQIDQRKVRDDYSHEPLLNLKAPVAPDALQVGTANWEKLPQLQTRERRLPYIQLVTIVREMLRKGECALPGQSAKAFDIEVRYAAFVDPEGKASRILVDDTHCAALNSLVGLAAMARSDRGDFSPTGDLKPHWYQDRFSLTLE